MKLKIFLGLGMPNPLKQVVQPLTEGWVGERQTEVALAFGRLEGVYKVLHDLYVPYKEKTSQVDVLLLHEKGAFVLESKNYSGWIFGSMESQNWTQCLSNGEKYSFYNPVFQNQAHIRALANYLQQPESAFFSYIVFSQHCELKKVPSRTQKCAVLKRRDLVADLRSELARRPVIYTQETIEMFEQKLQAVATPTLEIKNQHIARIKEQKESLICPFCGAALVERIGQYGPFYGCSTYPGCKYTKKK